jgi:hypothetical protein
MYYPPDSIAKTPRSARCLPLPLRFLLVIDHRTDVRYHGLDLPARGFVLHEQTCNPVRCRQQDLGCSDEHSAYRDPNHVGAAPMIVMGDGNPESDEIERLW